MKKSAAGKSEKSEKSPKEKPASTAGRHASPKLSAGPSTTMAELLDKTGYIVPSFNYGNIVEGTIASLSHTAILLDIGAKSEGIISGRELEENPGVWKTLKVGDKLSAFVVQAENDQGYVVLSLRRAYPQHRWKELEELYEKDEPFTVRLTEFNKGGFLADAGVPGFVPMSQLSRKHVTEIQKNHGEMVEKTRFLIGQTISVKIIEMDRILNRLVLSEKEVLSEGERKSRTDFINALIPGQVVTGAVTGVMPFGLFIELGGDEMNIEGMVHLSELSWEKVNRASDLYKIGDVVTAKVLEVEPTLGRVALSIRSTQPNPWEGVAERYPVNSVVEGTVTKIVPFGAFVKLEKGVEGLIHVSETTGPLKAGEKVKAMVLDVNPSEQRLALSLKKMAKPASPDASPSRRVRAEADQGGPATEEKKETPSKS